MTWLTDENNNATFDEEKSFFHVSMFTHKFEAAFTGTHKGQHKLYLNYLFMNGLTKHLQQHSMI
jgi:hypothetical protein